ncbi:probable DNA polymerase lambda at C-terminar half [Coccomyxa sp. Obi]|nr:probable DNA polymerase lambda at C-terminar half [Coccomyxa sp. Obi]
MSVTLISQDNDTVIELGPAEKVSLGRKPCLNITAKSVGRDHCTVTTGFILEHRVNAVVFANRKVYIVRHGGATALNAGQSSQLEHGDILYLGQEGRCWKYGFIVDIPSTRQSYVEAGAEQKGSIPESPFQAPKRLRTSANRRQDCQSPHAPSETHTPNDKQQSINSTGVFQGLVFVFWTKSFMQPLMNRAKQAGAEVSDRLVLGDTTHVIAARDLSAEEIARRLEQVPEHAALKCYEVVYEGNKVLRLPKGIHFVTPEYVSESLAHNRLQRENAFLIDIARIATLAGSLERVVTSCFIDQGVPGGTAMHSSQGSGKGLVSLSLLDTRTISGRQQQAERGTEQSMHQHGVIKVAPKKGSITVKPLLRPSLTARTAQSAWDQWQKIGFVPVSEQSNADMACTGGSDPGSSGDLAHGVPEPVAERGSCRVWDVPFDKAAAEETVKILANHWHRQENKGHASRQSAPHSSSKQEDESMGVSASSALNSVCTHTACSAKNFCIVDQLEQIQSNYRKGRDQFKIKAMQRAIKAVVELSVALVTAEDCEKLDIGEKSIEKLQEIISTGEYRRNQIMAQDPHHRTVSLFMEVWGTGDATAERWYRDGCRSLEDVRGRSDLSTQQRTGLKYFEDFKQRIPRAEVAAVATVVHEAVEEVLQCRSAPDADMLFCSALGSYRRGKPMTGDVDMLIAPPPSCGDVDARHALHALCDCLRNKGFLLDDMAAAAPASRGEGATTFMGVARHATSPCARRIDIKFYPRRYLPFAILHFVGSGAFSRALRYWARFAASEASKHHPSANGFKLSDYGLVPILRKEPVRRESISHGAEVELGASLNCHSERDIFEALGLDYVPPHMRFFHDFE